MADLKHFLDLDRFDTATLRSIIDIGKALKGAGNGRGEEKPPAEKPLAGKALAMIFEKPSTRTRVSFEVGMRQLGGEAVVLEPSGTQLGRGETVADTARVLSRYVDAIMIRTTKQEKLLEMAEHATVPVINGLTDRTHPCQLMADIMTYEEHRGSIEGRVVTWCGDGNNMATSWLHAAARFGFELRLACPESLTPPPEVVRWARDQGARIVVSDDLDAMADATPCRGTISWRPTAWTSGSWPWPRTMRSSCIVCRPIVARRSRAG